MKNGANIFMLILHAESLNVGNIFSPGRQFVDGDCNEKGYEGVRQTQRRNLWQAWFGKLLAKQGNIFLYRKQKLPHP